jgi:aspartate/methionine/tyrosine aminotransferase
VQGRAVGLDKLPRATHPRARLRLSERSGLDLRPNAISEALQRARSTGDGVIDLTVSNPTLVDLPSHSLPTLDRPDSSVYSPLAFGLPSAREAVAAWMARHAVPVSADRIVLTASTSEAYAFLFKLLCDPGDEVLVPRPSYPLLAHLARFESVQLREYPIDFDGRFHIHESALREAMSARARAVIAVHPNNPTGSFLDRDELHVLGSLGLPFISDEVFAPYRLEVDASTPASALTISDGLVMTLHGLSKLGLPQLKLSWICFSGDDVLVEQAMARLEIIADAYLSVGTPAQLALSDILEGQEPFIDAIRARTRENLAALQRACAGSAASVLHAGGGWTAVVRMPATQSDESWALSLLIEQRTLVQPGYFYDFEGPPHVVLSLLPRPDVFQLGIQRLLEHMAQHL